MNHPEPVFGRGREGAFDAKASSRKNPVPLSSVFGREREGAFDTKVSSRNYLPVLFCVPVTGRRYLRLFGFWDASIGRG